MADYLASIFGTEKDKVNCSFYFKIGACRHGEKCSKNTSQAAPSDSNHKSSSLLNAESSGSNNMTEDELQQHFDDIFEELFIEMEARYGEIEEMNICDNLSEHLAGNTYVKFRSEQDAEIACQELNNRWFNGKPIYAELSPVTDFHEACCRQYQMGECPRGGFCNFMHLKPISNALRRKLFSVKYSKRMRREMEEEELGGGVAGEYDEMGYVGDDDGYGGGYSPQYSPTLMSSMGGGGSYYNESLPSQQQPPHMPMPPPHMQHHHHHHQNHPMNGGGGGGGMQPPHGYHHGGGYRGGMGGGGRYGGGGGSDYYDSYGNNSSGGSGGGSRQHAGGSASAPRSRSPSPKRRANSRGRRNGRY